MTDSQDGAVNERSKAHAIICHLFALSTVLFIIGGVGIVLAQSVLIIAADGTGANNVADAAGPYVFGTSSIAGLLAFVLTYFKKDTDPYAE
jgi:hypothetical protein